jgi:hypothetical protein
MAYSFKHKLAWVEDLISIKNYLEEIAYYKDRDDVLNSDTNSYVLTMHDFDSIMYKILQYPWFLMEDNEDE